MSELYKLPVGWGWKTLDSISSIVGGGTPKRNIREYWENGNIVWLSPTDLGNIGEISEVSSSKDMITKLGLDKSSAKLLPIGTVSYSSRATIGKIAINEIEVSTNQGFTNFICNDDLYNYYLAYCLSNFTNDIVSLSNSTTFKEVSKSSFKSFQIPLPPLAEQKRIVAKLDNLFEKIDKAIELHQQNITNANTLMASTLDKTFKKLEGEYSYKNLKDITIKIGSGATPKGGQKAYKQEGISLIRSMNVHDMGFTKKGLVFIDDSQADKLKNVIVEKGDVLLNITGASVARCCVVCESVLPARVNQHVSIIRLHDSFISKFLYYYLISPMKKTELLFSSSGGATREAITKSMIENFQVPDISLPVQQQTVEYLDSIATKVDKIKQLNEQKLENLKALKASILDKAFRGEL
ncbi:restriction endonuclease subunit S [Francisella sciaenopsi]|uniref:Restriction endonuclease subunit S n=1 Tax=Francisella sciaenopsi TaxID=3055034 RepID=A0ABQ6PEQ4_9GAMM